MTAPNIKVIGVSENNTDKEHTPVEAAILIGLKVRGITETDIAEKAIGYTIMAVGLREHGIRVIGIPEKEKMSAARIGL